MRINILNIGERKEKLLLFSILCCFILFSIVSKNGPGFIFAISFVIISLFISSTDLKDKEFLALTFAIAFLVRVVLTYAMHCHSCNAGFDGFISGDDRLYTLKAVRILHEWLHLPTSIEWDRGGMAYGTNHFVYLLAYYFRIFEPNYLNSKLINCLIGSATPILIYFTAKNIFEPRAAKIALLLSGFYPSIIMWSIGNFRDPLVFFLTAAAVYFIVSLRRTALDLVKITGAIICAYLLKQLQIAIFFAIIGSVALFLIYKIFQSIRIKLIAVLLALDFAVFGIAGYWLFQPAIVREIQSMINRSKGLSVSDNAGYFIYDSKIMEQLNSGILNLFSLGWAYLKGMAYFILSPFPWSISSLNQLIAYPQIIVWYFLLFFSLFGFMQGLRIARDKTLIIMTFLFIGISLFSVCEANIGAAFRHRDCFSMIFFIYSATGMTCLFTEKDAAKI